MGKKEKQRCWQCGASIRSGDSLCPKCGAVANIYTSPVRAPQAVDSSRSARASSMVGASLPAGTSPHAGTPPPASYYQSSPVLRPPSTRFCGVCGTVVLSSNEYCLACGSRLADQELRPQQSAIGGENLPPSWTIYSRNAGNNPAYYAQGNNSDEWPFVFAILGFFFPLVGLILFIAWQNSMPLRAKAAGKGALASVIVGISITCVFFVVIFATAPFILE